MTTKGGFNYKHKLDLLNDISHELSEKEDKICRNPAILKAYRKRQEIWDKVAVARRAYATTKNDDGEGTVIKGQHRTELNRLIQRLEKQDKTLAELREVQVSLDGLPSSYKKTVSQLNRYLKMTDQDIRVSGVHYYMEKEVLSRMKMGCD